NRMVPPPSFGPLDKPPPSTWNTRPASGVNLGSMRLVFERTELVTVRGAARTGVIESGAGMEWLCYTDTVSEVPARIWFVARAAITSVTAERISRGTGASKRCPLLPLQLRPVVFDQGLAVGMPAMEVKGKVGDPSSTWKDWWIYHHEGTAGG